MTRLLTSSSSGDQFVLDITREPELSFNTSHMTFTTGDVTQPVEVGIRRKWVSRFWRGLFEVPEDELRHHRSLEKSF